MRPRDGVEKVERPGGSENLLKKTTFAFGGERRLVKKIRLRLLASLFSQRRWQCFVYNDGLRLARSRCEVKRWRSAHAREGEHLFELTMKTTISPCLRWWRSPTGNGPSCSRQRLERQEEEAKERVGLKRR